MFYKIELDLVLTNFDIDPNQVSEMLSLTPIVSWLKGESIQRTARKHKTNGWRLSSGLDNTAELDDHINALFAKIKPALSNFNNLPTSTEKEVSCVIYIYHKTNNTDEEHRTPPIHLEREHVEILNQMGAEFDLDLYVLPED
jgi:uncharacterized protein DUF4279